MPANQWIPVPTQEEADEQQRQRQRTQTRETFIGECQMGIINAAGSTDNVEPEKLAAMMSGCETMVDEVFDGESLTELAESAAEGFVGPGGVVRARAKKAADLAVSLEKSVNEQTRGASAELADMAVSGAGSIPVPSQDSGAATRTTNKQL